MTTAVAVRGYSRNSRATSDEIVTGTPGSRASSASRMRLLVLVVEITEQERDRDRLGVAPRDLPGRPARLGLGQRLEDLALAAEPLGHLDPVAPRHQLRAAVAGSARRPPGRVPSR